MPPLTAFVISSEAFKPNWIEMFGTRGIRLRKPVIHLFWALGQSDTDKDALVKLKWFKLNIYIPLVFMHPILATLDTLDS